MKRRLVSTLWSASVLFCASALLVACGDDNVAPGSGGATKQPAEVVLEVGTTARVQVESPIAGIETPGVMDVTVTSIDRGDPSDLVGTDVAGVDGKVPTYVTYTMTAVSGRLDSVGLSGYVRADTTAGGTASAADALPLNNSAGVHGCEVRGFPPTGVKEDQAVTSCITFLLPAEAPVLDRIVFVSGGA